MRTYRRILIPLDGSELSRWVLARARRLLEQPGLSVTLLTVVETDEERASDLSFRVDPRDHPVQEALGAAKSELLERSVAAHAEIRFGDPATEILREIAGGGHDLVAMSTHGRTGLGRMMFGSVALKVLQASPVPLLLFRPLQRADETLSPAETSEPATFKRILVPLDSSEAAEQVLPAAEAMARTFGSKLHLFTAIPGGAEEASSARVAEEYLNRCRRILGGHDLVSLVEVRTGPAAEEALAAIREHGLDAVAMTTHGRSGLARAMYGSVAERILLEAEIPVLLLRSRGLRKPITKETEQFRVTRV